MEGKFETSFIPKKPLGTVSDGGTVKPVKTTNFFSLIAGVIFITILVLALAVFGYHYYLTSKEKKLTAALEEQLKNFAPQDVAEFSRVDARIESVKKILNQHVAFSSFFDYLNKTTVRSVRFTTFQYTVANGKLGVKMSGVAPSYAAVAQQSLEFAKQFEGGTMLTNHTFSGFDLDTTGNVTFVFDATIPPQSILYQNLTSVASAPVILYTGTSTSTATTSPR